MFPDLMRDDVFRLETERLWLRWPRAADAARIAEFAGDRDVAEMTASIPHPYPQGAAAEFVLTTRAGNLSGRQIVMALTLKQRPNEMIGSVGLFQTGPTDAMLGYWLAKPLWRQGLMSEAACALVQMVMRTANPETITSWIRPANVASRRVLEKVGFAPNGFGVETALARGGKVQAERFRLERAAWNGCGATAMRTLEFAQAN